MDDNVLYLSGLGDEKLPPILPNTAGELLAVNASETGYELVPTENVIPEPISSKQILNSTAANVWDWTNDPIAVSYTADTGAANGFKFDQTTSSIIHEANVTKIINQGTSRVECSTSGVDLKGAVSVDSLITCPTGSSNGLGISGQSTRIDFANNVVNLRVNGTVRVQCLNNGVSLFGSITQNNQPTNTNNFYGNTNFGNGTMTIDQPVNLLTTNSISLVNGNVSTTNGQVNGNNIKATNAGTTALCSVRVVDDNCGLYQNTTGQLDIVGGGVRALNIASTRCQTTNHFVFGRPYTLTNNVIVASGSNSITTSGSALYIAKGHATLNQDLDFSTTGNYSSGQEIKIITLDVVGNQLIRYRAQSTTQHIQNGTLVTITANTYHTLEKNRMYIVYTDVDSAQFYLIRI